MPRLEGRSLARGVGYCRKDGQKHLPRTPQEGKYTMSQGRGAFLKEENAAVTTAGARASPGRRESGSSCGPVLLRGKRSSDRNKDHGVRLNLPSSQRFNSRRLGTRHPLRTNLLRHGDRTSLLELNINAEYKAPS